MRKFLYTLIMLLSLPWATIFAQLPEPCKYEYRAVWLTTIENLDWPRVQVKSAADVPLQKEELVMLLDSLQTLGINTVLLQTRVRGDVIYPSSIEPFSHVLTGVEGRNPGYDPLAFAIEECHKRGMQLHAWLVTLPLGKSDHVHRMGSMSLPRKQRAMCTYYRGAWYMEPGNPATVDYITKLVEEIVKNYDVDGIHLDYVRYPDSVDGYPDGALYRKYGRGSTLAHWRRGNITKIVRSVYSAVKRLKPWVRVSCAPLGKYSSVTRYSSFGWDAYSAVFQDAQGWLREGIMDIIFPMLYYNGNHFYPFVRDWNENSCGRHIVPGLGIYRLMPEYGGWPQIEIKRQMLTSRAVSVDGVMMFRTAHLVGNAGGAREVYTSIYNTPALVPPMQWAAKAPASPLLLSCMRDDAGVTFSWDSVDAPDGYPATRYNVYASLGDNVDTEDARNIVAVSLSGTSFRWPCRTSKEISVAVTAVNAYGIESVPAVLHAGCGASFLRGDTVELPESRSWGQRIEVVDVYGRRVFFGKYSRSFNVSGFAVGFYRLNVYDRHGALLFSRQFVR